jgi:two-component system chemotaxis sensor kinase CheA
VSLDEIYAVIEAAVNIESYELLDAEAPLDDFEAVHISTADGPTEDDIPREEVTPAQAARAMLPGSGRQQSLISVHQYKLDQLMDLMGELVTTESMVINNVDLRDMRLDNFSKSARELRKLTDELQDVVMSIRMVPLSGVFQRMQRIARDVSKKLDKQVELITLGGETEVDKTINDAIGDPFMHMVRNSVDHGIEDPQTRRRLGKPEVGRIVMEAKNVGGEIVITISDDGKGLDADKILDKARRNGLLTKPESEYSKTEIYNLIMLPGFSTNQAVTEFSGRGVGMDVVRQNIEKVGGSINIDSTPNEGSTFTIKIPLTLAIVDGMELAVGDTIFTLPITSIQQSFKVNDPKQILYNTDGSEMILLRGKCFPIIRLHRIFNFETEITDITEGILILVEGAREEACIFVDELLGEQQVVVKPFPPFLSKYAVKRMGLSGCTILGDGTISLILDANNLLAQHH